MQIWFSFQFPVWWSVASYCNRSSVKMVSENSSEDEFETLHGLVTPYLFEPAVKAGAVQQEQPTNETSCGRRLQDMSGLKPGLARPEKTCPTRPKKRPGPAGAVHVSLHVCRNSLSSFLVSGIKNSLRPTTNHHRCLHNNRPANERAYRQTHHNWSHESTLPHPPYCFSVDVLKYFCCHLVRKELNLSTVLELSLTVIWQHFNCQTEWKLKKSSIQWISLSAEKME